MDSQLISSTNYVPEITQELLEKWSDMPSFPENDPLNPEWGKTPVIPISFEKEGYGIVFVKNGGDRNVNPTGVEKDRPSWEVSTLYRDYARSLGKQLLGSPIPKVSIISSGNAALSLSHAFEQYGLPPPNVIVDAHVSSSVLQILSSAYLDVYQVDLSDAPLLAADIKKITNTQLDLTSSSVFAPERVFYDWHVHESFNENPDAIFVPYGSGKLFENYVYWQSRNISDKDPRLIISQSKLASIDLFGATPESLNSKADKLIAPFNPFVQYTKNDFSEMKFFGRTGTETGIYKLSETYICRAYDMLKKHISVEPSAASGLALYLQRFDEGKIEKGSKNLIISSGKGLWFEKD